MEAAPPVARRAIVGKQDVRTPAQKRTDAIEKVYYDNKNRISGRHGRRRRP